MTTLTESDVEQASLDWLADIAPDMLDDERTNYGQDDVFRKLTRPASPLTLPQT